MPARRVLLLVLLLCAALLPLLRAQKSPAPVSPLHAVLIGGGPTPGYNPVALENNIRYARRILPPGAHAQTLWTDGGTRAANVLFTDADGKDHYRPTVLTDVDGPLRLPAIADAVKTSGAGPTAPLLLYFTGHGAPGDTDYDNNNFELWHGEELSVHRLSGMLDALPAQTPVTVVMVQCYSGAFGNLLFAGGDPQGPLNPRPFCGFFASVPTRTAAGCTSEVDEADYHDFTSYFFAALSGQTRTGKTVTGADYNGDGRVGMNEAFAYTVLRDVSIDTPVCTSDVFLRRFVPSSDGELMRTRYSVARAWADPAQCAVLDGLSVRLKLTGENRMGRAYREFVVRMKRDPDTESEAQEERDALWVRFVRMAKSVVLAHRLQLNGTAERRAQFAALRRLEAGNPLRP